MFVYALAYYICAAITVPGLDQPTRYCSWELSSVSFYATQELCAAAAEPDGSPSGLTGVYMSHQCRRVAVELAPSKN
jgi:hypothetical protein